MLDRGAHADWLHGVEPTDESPNRRWARFVRPDGAVVYLQERGWDSETRPDYLVVLSEGDESRHVLCGSVDEALGVVRQLVQGAA